jgi:sulfoxide reductase heme-binding subunit YedZ
VSIYLVAAVVVTSLARERIGHRAWRAIHWASYMSWPLAIEHTLTAGSDAFAIWMLGITAVCVLAVTAAAVYRFTAEGTNRSRLVAVGQGIADPIAVEPAWRND